jgi:hypothetical protein
MNELASLKHADPSVPAATADSAPTTDTPRGDPVISTVAGDEDKETVGRATVLDEEVLSEDSYDSMPDLDCDTSDSESEPDDEKEPDLGDAKDLKDDEQSAVTGDDDEDDEVTVPPTSDDNHIL